MGRVRQASSAQRRHVATVRRDAALARVSSITAAVGVAVVITVGALGVYVAKALPGHHAASTGTSAAANPGTSAPAGNSGSLSPPSTPPQATSSPAQVTSAPS